MIRILQKLQLSSYNKFLLRSYKNTKIGYGGKQHCIDEHLKVDSLFSNNANDIGCMHNFSLQ